MLCILSLAYLISHVHAPQLVVSLPKVLAQQLVSEQGLILAARSFPPQGSGAAAGL